MSPKIWTVIAGASLGLLMSAACTVTSTDDDGGSGGTGVGAGPSTGGSGTGGDATGGTGTGGTGVGGGEACLSCGEVVSSTTDVAAEDICGYTLDNGNPACFEGSSCDLFFSMFAEACGDGVEAGACEAQCADSLCAAEPTLPEFGNAQDTCANCVEATSSYQSCIID